MDSLRPVRLSLKIFPLVLSMNKLSFKYLQVDTEERLKFLERLLILGQLWFPSAIGFNDPNEFRCQLRAPKRKSIIRRQYFADNSEAAEQDFESWYRTVSWKSWHLYQEPLIQRTLLSNLGVLCLSRTCRNPIMWAHYAGRHTGICVAFKVEVFAQIDNLIRCESVVYRKRLPRVKYFGEDQTEVIKKILLTKYSGWAYEKEFRAITWEGDITKQIAPSVIDGVILGMNVSKDKEEQVLRMIEKRQSPTKVFKAGLSYLTYEMDITNRFSHELSESDISDYR